MTGLARLVFALLVCATFGAFFVAQRVKSTPPAVQNVGVYPFFSPNGDGRFDRARITFSLKRADEVSVTIVDEEGEPVRTLESSRHLGDGVVLPALRWDGRRDSGLRAPDGFYRVRVGLRHQGRAVLLPHGIRLDTVPPRPQVVGIGPVTSKVPSPEFLPRPSGGSVIVHFAGPTRRAEAVVYRTAPFRPTAVTTLSVDPKSHTATWDGTVDGRRVRAGTYLVVLLARDQAGNIGSSIPGVKPGGLRTPVLSASFARRGSVPGHGGVTVRYLVAQPPLVPNPAGALLRVGVDARGEPYRWSVRRVGDPRPTRRGRKTKAVMALHAPGRFSGLYVLDLRAGSHTAAVPLVVQARRRERVLVVLPAIGWQGTNPQDDDGDGVPNTLAAAVPVRRSRVFGGLPAELSSQVAPVLIYLDRKRLRYDITTDLALATGAGPRLTDHAGVLLAGDERWLPTRVVAQLRRFVRRGGNVASLGADSLRRRVRVTPKRLIEPTAPSATDIFGARLRPVARKRVTLFGFQDDIGLFKGAGGLLAGGSGIFKGFNAYEETASVGTRAEQVAAAGPQSGRPIVVAVRYGRGLVIRTGLPEFARRLSRDADTAGLMRRIWTLLRR
jgi:N,N-dimethylformamidase beta subunit-like, C-terminal/FlgD Ig-like domain